MTSAFRCAAAATERSEELAGTASRADRFILVEFPTPWPRKALEVFSDDVRDALADATAAARAKVLLVRRPGLRTGELRRWAVADARARRALWGTWETPADLEALVDAVGATSTDGWSDEPVALVCTHARHDTCCGVRGRPLAAALAASHGDLVWESSHVGGHRFAGNLVFPLDGTYYGRVDADSAAGLVDSHIGGSQVAVEHLRGFSWLEPAAQAVAVEAHRRWGPAGVDAIRHADVVGVAPDVWRVELTCSDALPASIAAEVKRVAGPEARLSCLADPSPTESYVIQRLDAEGS
ncbi:MAG: sucrase ferredoxin [Aeromicrobium sp.]